MCLVSFASPSAHPKVMHQRTEEAVFVPVGGGGIPRIPNEICTEPRLRPDSLGTWCALQSVGGQELN